MPKPHRVPRAVHAAPAHSSTWVFVREFLRAPREVGTVFPCSPAVAKAMIRGLDTSAWNAAVELGPGNGVLTPTLIEGLPLRCRFLAVELSRSLAAEFRDRLPGVEIAEADATELMRICLARGIGQLDAIFSAIPVRLLSLPAMSDLLRSAAAMLRPGGVLAQVTYWPAALPPGRQLRERFAAEIGPVESDRLVAGNTPPAWVFRCIKPLESR